MCIKHHHDNYSEFLTPLCDTQNNEHLPHDTSATAPSHNSKVLLSHLCIPYRFQISSYGLSSHP